ncbi:hypothetical protein [Lysobacter capsici]|nr:hypothetical protein [Lysobacter capsici]WND79381.1 hypothetical protein RJ610_19070 [Lysobacter capsici]WND84577.1 hypothetical protein RJ609_19085 [Lysobacter capsici]
MADFSDVTSRVAPSLAERYEAAGINPNVKATDGESFLGNAAAGFGASYVDSKDAIRQLASQGAAAYSRGVKTVQGAGLPAPQFAKDIVGGLADATSSYEKKVQGEIDQRKKYDEALKHSGGGLVGNAAGVLSQFLIPGGAASRLAGGSRAIAAGTGGAAGLVARALLPSTIRGAAAQGAVVGASQPVASDESRLANAGIGALAGAGGATIGKGIGIGLNKLAGIGSNVSRALFGESSPKAVASRAAEFLRSEADDASRLLTPAPSAVPGVQRTLAEESLDPGIARLERLLRTKGGAAWGDIDRSSNSARVNALAAFGKDKPAVDAAKAARSANAKPLLDQALLVNNVDSAPVEKVVDDLIAASKGRPAVQSGLAQIKPLLSRLENGQVVPEDRVKVLYNVRKTIGDMLAGKYGGDSAAALAGSRELMALKDSLDDAITQASPEFGQYLTGFVADSAPIARMQIGQDLMRRGGAVPDALTGQTTLTPAQFSKASVDLDRVAAKATGFAKAKSDDYLQPQDKSTIAAIQDDLQRRAAVFNSPGGPGNSATAERIFGDNRLAESAAAKLASKIPLFGPISQHLREKGQQRLQEKLALVLMYPDQARLILQAMPAQDRQALQRALTQGGAVVGNVNANRTE